MASVFRRAVACGAYHRVRVYRISHFLKTKLEPRSGLPWPNHRSHSQAALLGRGRETCVTPRYAIKYVAYFSPYLSQKFPQPRAVHQHVGDCFLRAVYV